MHASKGQRSIDVEETHTHTLTSKCVIMQRTLKHTILMQSIRLNDRIHSASRLNQSMHTLWCGVVRLKFKRVPCAWSRAWTTDRAMMRALARWGNGNDIGQWKRHWIGTKRAVAASGSSSSSNRYTLTFRLFALAKESADLMRRNYVPASQWVSVCECERSFDWK